MIYIFNPGDMRDVEVSSELPVERAHFRVGQLYKAESGRLWHFDHNSQQWFEYDAHAYNASVPIKVLRAAGLHP